MLRKILFISLIITVAVSSLINMFPTDHVSGHVQDQAEVSEADEVLQRSTVLITFYSQERLVDAQAGVYEVGTGKGLGTLIASEGQQLIVTHDHWRLLNNDLQRVEYHDKRGNLLASTSGSEFSAGILFRDGGTIIVKAPVGLAGDVTQAKMGTMTNDSVGLQVQIVRNTPASSNAIGVMDALVEAIELKQGRQVLVLRSVNGAAIVRGDSGGGVYFNGQLVGNMWSTIAEKVTTTKNGFFGSTIQVESSHDQSRAAIFTPQLQSLLPLILTNGVAPSLEMGGAS